MKQENYQKVKRIFQSAVELASGDRAAFLKKECGEKGDLRREVERLLNARDSDFMEEPAVAQVAEVLIDEESEPTKMLPGNQQDKQFGNYRVISKIGQGGMGEVFLAKDKSLDRNVAIKFLNKDLSHDTDKLNRFIQEAKAASALNHPNILTVFEIGKTKETRYIATEFIEGRTLHETLLRKEILSLKSILKIATQIAEALSAAHDAGIVHRDIKPENIMVRDDGYVKVLDFGLAKLSEPSGIAHGLDIQEEATTRIRIKTDTGMVMGTASYMSPEQARGKEVDERTDIFSFGVLLYEMIAGNLPFRGDTLSDLLVAILEKEPVPVSRFAPDTPADLQHIIAKTLRKDKSGRYQSMKSLLADLKTLKKELEFEEKLEQTNSPETTKDGETLKTDSKHGGTIPVRARTMDYLNRYWIRVAIGLLVISSLALGYYFFVSTAATPLTDKDIILLTDFENKTGEEIFDSTLKQGLTIALQQSPFLSIFPDSKAYETLKLMKRNPEEPITRELGRDICQREGLKAYIVGTITKLGSIYVIGLEAVNGQTGERIVLTQTQAPADDQKNILAALSKAATEMRKKLGEPLAQLAKSDKSLEEVTTSSLEAFKAFTMARESERRGDLSEWILHCRRAIKIDPRFAMAYKGLGVVYFNLAEYTLAEEADRKAYELRERLSEREKLYVIAGHYRWTQEVDKHIATLKLLKSMYPREPDAMNDLGLEYQSIGDYEKALEEFRLAVNTPPKDLVIFANLVKAYIHLNRYEEAKKAVEKAVKNGFERHEFEYLLYLLAFINNDEAEMQRVVELKNGKIHPWLRIRLRAYSGQWQQSMKFYRQQINLQVQDITKEPQATQNAVRAMRAAEIGQCSQAQSLANDSLKRFRSWVLTWRATFAFARCGNISQTQSLINEIQEKYPDSTYYNGFGIPIYRAMIELNKDNPKEAIKLLETVRRYESSSFYWVQTVRGEAYLKLNENKKAGIEFQTILDHRGWYPLSPLYPLAQLGKARAMQDKKEYEKFFEMWKDADKDLPALIAAKKEYEALN